MKPLLLVDVDGVLLLQNSLPGLESCDNGWIDPANRERLAELSQVFTPVWCTGWGVHANVVIAPLFGLPEWPVIDLKMPADWVPRPQYVPGSRDDTRNKATNWKLPSVRRWLSNSHQSTPAAWLDDQIGQTDVKRWAQRRGLTKLQHVFERIGLDREAFSLLMDWGENLP